MTLTSKSLLLVLSLIVGCAMPAIASEPASVAEPVDADRPAVDGVNAKFSVGHSLGGAEIYWGGGSVAVPLSHRFGFQLDGVAAEADAGMFGDLSIYGAAVHLFWRDPSRALVGFYGSTIHIAEFGGLDLHVAALESEHYWDRVTLESLVGLSYGDIVDPELYSMSTLAYYPTDNLRLHARHTYVYGSNNFTLGGEWALNTNSATTASLFANGTASDGGETTAMAGLRLYLGQREKSLIRRHREDDPPGETVILLMNEFFKIDGLPARYSPHVRPH